MIRLVDSVWVSPGNVDLRNLSILKVDSSIRAAPKHMHAPSTRSVVILIKFSPYSP